MASTVGTYSAFQNVNDGGSFAWETPNNAATSNNARSICGPGQTWGPSTNDTSQLLRSNSAITWSAGVPNDVVSVNVNVEGCRTSTLVRIDIFEIGWWQNSTGTREVSTGLTQQLPSSTGAEASFDFPITVSLADLLHPDFYIDVKVRSNAGGSSSSSGGNGPAVDFLRFTVEANTVSFPVTLDVDLATVTISGLGQTFNNDTGVLSPGTLATSGGSTPWLNPTNAASSNNVYATMTASATEANNGFLRATNFNPGIPDDATILGAVFEIERHRNSSGSGQIVDNVVQLVVSGTGTGDNKASGVNWDITTNVYTTYGNSSDLWGVALTPAIVNSSDFGIQLRVDSTLGGRVANVDHIRMTIYYSTTEADVEIVTPILVVVDEASTITLTAFDASLGAVTVQTGEVVLTPFGVSLGAVDVATSGVTLTPFTIPLTTKVVTQLGEVALTPFDATVEIVPPAGSVYDHGRIIGAASYNKLAAVTADAAPNDFIAANRAGYLYGIGFGSRGYGQSTPALTTAVKDTIIPAWSDLQSVLSTLCTWQEFSPTLGAYAAEIAEDAPIGWWRLGESAGETAVDEIGDNDLTYAGTYTLEEPGALVGDADTAVQFTSSTTQGDDEAAFALGKVDFSLETWMKFTSTEFSSVIAIRNKAAPGTPNIQVILTTNRISEGDISAETWAWVDAATRVRTPTPKNDGEWHHVVVTYRASDNGLRLYIDGDLEDARYQGSASFSSADCTVTIGSNVSGIQQFEGVLDEVAFYDSELTPGRVLDHYLAGQDRQLLPSVPSMASGALTVAFPTGEEISIPDLLALLDDNRLNYVMDNMTLTAAAATSTRATPWSDTITAEFSVTFANENATRYFFNTGGEVRIALEHPEESTAQDTDWHNVLDNLVVALRAVETVRLSGSTGDATDVGYYDLTTDYETIYDGTDAGSGAYSSNDYLVEAKALSITGLNGAKGSEIWFRVTLTDQHANVHFDEVAVGTNVVLSHLRANAVLTTLPAAPMCSVESDFDD